MEQLSPCPNYKPRHLEPVIPKKRSQRNEEPPHHIEEELLLHTAGESLHTAEKTQCGQKANLVNLFIYLFKQ